MTQLPSSPAVVANGTQVAQHARAREAGGTKNDKIKLSLCHGWSRIACYLQVVCQTRAVVLFYRATWQFRSRQLRIRATQWAARKHACPWRPVPSCLTNLTLSEKRPRACVWSADLGVYGRVRATCMLLSAAVRRYPDACSENTPQSFQRDVLWHSFYCQPDAVIEHGLPCSGWICCIICCQPISRQCVLLLWGTAQTASITSPLP